MKILFSLIKKEFYQITRDISSILIAFILPFILLLIFAYAINLDNNTIKVGLLVDGYNNELYSLVKSFEYTKFLDTSIYDNRQKMEEDIVSDKIKAMIIIPNDFMKNLNSDGNVAKIQVLIDGSDPNISTFVESYVSGVINNWLKIYNEKNGKIIELPLDITMSTWFNQELKSRNLVIPSSISIIMSLVGMILTALVIAREWERGTMESLLTTKVSKMDIILSKYISYYFLALCSTIFCSVICIVFFKVPFKGSYVAYFISSSLFIITSLGQGLLISTLCKNQFLASMAVSIFGFMPATMLSGMLFEIPSMPKIVQIITMIVPARYFSACIRNLFVAGNIWSVLIPQCIFLFIFSILLFYLVYIKTGKRLE